MDIFNTAIKEKDTAEVKLRGDINFYVSPEVRNTILRACKKDIHRVVVDFASVTSMDTSGVAALIEGLKWSRKEGKSFVLKNVGTNVRNALELTKLETAFPIVPGTRDSGTFA